MISDILNNQTAINQMKACFFMQETSIMMDIEEFDRTCAYYGVDPDDMINEVLEEMFDSYDAMNSIQRDEVLGALGDYGQCEMNSIYERFPS